MYRYIWESPDRSFIIGACVSREDAINHWRNSEQYGERGDHHFTADRLKIVPWELDIWKIIWAAVAQHEVKGG